MATQVTPSEYCIPSAVSRCLLSSSWGFQLAAGEGLPSVFKPQLLAPKAFRDTFPSPLDLPVPSDSMKRLSKSDSCCVENEVSNRQMGPH